MRITTTFFICLFLPLLTFAKHIIGGGFSYRCLDNGQYELTLTIFRDCNGGGANFDNPAIIALYQGSDTAPLLTLDVNVENITYIDPAEQIDDPCIIIPSGICVEEGTYTFIVNLPVWPSTESYHIVYQRCCRNNSISNIQNPGDVGATYAIEITPESQLECNNSPVFDNFPPILLCANQPIDFQQSAFDEEGDQIIYELCEPLLGAGNEGAPGVPGDPFGCNGIFPQPPCPPPFPTPDYVPPFTAFNPLAGSPPLSIDAITGELSGTPTALGQYVVAICAKEYRNGQLLSTIRREFQFNITSCELEVWANFDLPTTGEPQHFIKESCSKTVNIQSTSIWTPGQDIVLWELQVQDSIYIFANDEFNFEFPEVGSYSSVFYINPQSALCSDTAWVDFIIHPEVHADFDFSYDSCVAGPVNFEDLSLTEAGQELSQWLWTFGDSQSSQEQNPAHEYYNPGDFQATLQVTDINGCQDNLTQTISYYPAPSVIVVSPGEDYACTGQPLFFENQSHPIDETYRVYWEFGDGNTDSLINPYHTYAQSGVYDIYLSITSPWNCFIDTIFPALIEVFESPIAEFDYTPQPPSNLEPEVQFTDDSHLAAHWLWLIDENSPFSNEPNPVYIFPDTGLYQVMLIAITQKGCRDTIRKEIDIVPKHTFYIPNAFTPNFDRLNDFFQPKGIFFGLRNYQLQIWDRYGELVFESFDLRQGWNGNRHNTGRPLPSGTYLYQLSYVEARGKRIVRKGTLVLIR